MADVQRQSTIVDMAGRRFRYTSPEQEERQRAQIAEARKTAQTIDIDGKTYTLVTLPDRYPKRAAGSKLNDGERELIGSDS